MKAVLVELSRFRNRNRNYISYIRKTPCIESLGHRKNLFISCASFGFRLHLFCIIILSSFKDVFLLFG